MMPLLKYEKWDLGGGCCEGKESVWLDIALDEKAFGAPDRLATVGTSCWYVGRGTSEIVVSITSWVLDWANVAEVGVI